MTVTTIIVGMTLASFAGGFFFKTYSLKEDILHLIIGFCCYGISNALFLMALNQTGIAKAITLGSVFQITLTTLVAVSYFRETVTIQQGAGVALACAAAVLVMTPDA